MDGGGNVLRIKAVPIHAKIPCLVIQAAEKNCIGSQGTLVQTSAGLHSLLNLSTASIRLDASVPAGKWRPSLIRLRDADTL